MVLDSILGAAAGRKIMVFGPRYQTGWMFELVYKLRFLVSLNIMAMYKISYDWYMCNPSRSLSFGRVRKIVLMPTSAFILQIYYSTP